MDRSQSTLSFEEQESGIDVVSDYEHGTESESESLKLESQPPPSRVDEILDLPDYSRHNVSLLAFRLRRISILNNANCRFETKIEKFQKLKRKLSEVSQRVESLENRFEVEEMVKAIINESVDDVFDSSWEESEEPPAKKPKPMTILCLRRIPESASIKDIIDWICLEFDDDHVVQGVQKNDICYHVVLARPQSQVEEEIEHLQSEPLRRPWLSDYVSLHLQTDSESSCALDEDPLKDLLAQVVEDIFPHVSDDHTTILDLGFLYKQLEAECWKLTGTALEDDLKFFKRLTVFINSLFNEGIIEDSETGDEDGLVEGLLKPKWIEYVIWLGTRLPTKVITDAINGTFDGGYFEDELHDLAEFLTKPETKTVLNEGIKADITGPLGGVGDLKLRYLSMVEEGMQKEAINLITYEAMHGRLFRNCVNWILDEIVKRTDDQYQQEMITHLAKEYESGGPKRRDQSNRLMNPIAKDVRFQQYLKPILEVWAKEPLANLEMLLQHVTDDIVSTVLEALKTSFQEVEKLTPNDIQRLVKYIKLICNSLKEQKKTEKVSKLLTEICLPIFRNRFEDKDTMLTIILSYSDEGVSQAVLDVFREETNIFLKGWAQDLRSLITRFLDHCKNHHPTLLEKARSLLLNLFSRDPGRFCQTVLAYGSENNIRQAFGYIEEEMKTKSSKETVTVLRTCLSIGMAPNFNMKAKILGLAHQWFTQSLNPEDLKLVMEPHIWSKQTAFLSKCLAGIDVIKNQYNIGHLCEVLVAFANTAKEHKEAIISCLQTTKETLKTTVAKDKIQAFPDTWVRDITKAQRCERACEGCGRLINFLQAPVQTQTFTLNQALKGCIVRQLKQRVYVNPTECRTVEDALKITHRLLDHRENPLSNQCGGIYLRKEPMVQAANVTPGWKQYKIVSKCLSILSPPRDKETVNRS